MIHAFAVKDLGKGDLATACGLLFPSHLRISSPQDMPAGDKVSSEVKHVDCPACLRALGILHRFGHPVWPGAKCGNCGYVEVNTSGGPYDDIFLYKRTCVTCKVDGCDNCLHLTPASDVMKYVKKDGTCYVEGECIKCRGEK